MTQHVGIHLTNTAPSIAIEDAAAWTVGGMITAAALLSPVGILGGALCAGGGYLVGAGLQWTVSRFWTSNSSLGTAILATISATVRIFSVIGAFFALSAIWGVPVTFLGALVFSSVAYTIASILHPLVPKISF